MQAVSCWLRNVVLSTSHLPTFSCSRSPRLPSVPYCPSSQSACWHISALSLRCCRCWDQHSPAWRPSASGCPDFISPLRSVSSTRPLHVGQLPEMVIKCCASPGAPQEGCEGCVLSWASLQPGSRFSSEAVLSRDGPGLKCATSGSHWLQAASGDRQLPQASLGEAALLSQGQFSGRGCRLVSSSWGWTH